MNDITTNKKESQMKVLGISCSLRKKSNTQILVEEALAGAREAGAAAELVSLIGREIKPCDGCYACDKTGRCHIKDDMQPIYDQMLAADGIIIGTPIYFWNMAGQTKVLLDRTIALRAPNLRLANKVGGSIVVAARTGLMNAASAFYTYFASNHMVAADYVAGLADARGAVKKDEFAMKEAWEMGKQMVALIGQGFKFAEEYDRPLYSYVNSKYGVNSPPFE